MTAPGRIIPPLKNDFPSGFRPPYHREREQERKQAEREPELRRLRLAMADAHPDRGGTAEAFMTARRRYEQALRRAS